MITGPRFPNPCPVCGDTDEHAAWRATVTGSPCTLCPHPAERGHGTGCCCAGLSGPLRGSPNCGKRQPPVPDLEERVAALEAAIAALEPDFMTRTTAEPLNGAGLTGDAGHLTIRLTHQPTGIEVVARDRADGIARLRRALTDRARREFDLQEAERRAQRKAAQAQEA
jgi:hypothetical protein